MFRLFKQINGGRLLSTVAMLAVSSAFLIPQVASAQNGATAVPHYDSTPCQFDGADQFKVDCGMLTVLEDRSQPNGPTIQVAVAVFHALGHNPKPDPIIYLDGGPGIHTLDLAAYTFQDPFSGFARNRDFIMFDQRGVGLSQPVLDCPETTQALDSTVAADLTSKERQAADDQALAECHDRLVKAGVNLAAYNTAENAADVNDLRLALGYKSWNLYGISYGTRLALTIMRDFPDGIRSVILDSTLPLQVDLYAKLPGNADRAFQVFFQGCLKEASCNAAYPELDKVFYTLVDKLNKTPVTIHARQRSGRTVTTRNVKIDGDLFIQFLYNALYSTSEIIALPEMIWEAHDGNYTLLERAFSGRVAQNESESAGMYYSVQCSEEVSFDDQASLAAATNAFPKIGGAFDMSNYYNVCKQWNVPTRPDIEKKAVTSAAPTLILSGEYDPITPPSWGYLASQTLRHSFYLVFPGVGHGVSVGDECPYKVTQAFLNDPSVRPQIDCMSVMQEPDFVVN